MNARRHQLAHAAPTFGELFTPKLITVLREGYGRPDLRQDAVAIAILGAIESLLSVADGMTGTRHRSNCELAAQGVANIASVIFGGICVTGTIARTATNIRAGARGPIAGIFHCVYLLAFLMVAAPLISYIPLAALSAVLVLVAWRMAEKEEFWSLLRGFRGDAVVLLATFLLTIFVNLITGIASAWCSVPCCSFTAWRKPSKLRVGRALWRKTLPMTRAAVRKSMRPRPLATTSGYIASAARSF